MINPYRYLPEFCPKRLKQNLKRLWRSHINPPKERKQFLSPEHLPVIAMKRAQIATREQPKQVAYHPGGNVALVTCMKGRALQIFHLEKEKFSLETELEFETQPVEVKIIGDKALVTTTNFQRPPYSLDNRLWIIDIASRKIISSVETGGNWSKYIAVHSQKRLAFVSNWHSHDISIIDISNLKKPELKQLIRWGESPRGIAFTSKGDKAIVTGFYSGNIGELQPDSQGNWQVVFTSQPFDHPRYSGNMRHLVISADDQYAIISNLGRNLIHWWSIPKRRFADNIPVGQSPNSIEFIDGDKELLAVSCRDSNSVYLVDTIKRRVIGRSEKTGKKPTGLSFAPGGFLITNFRSNTLEFYQLKG